MLLYELSRPALRRTNQKLRKRLAFKRGGALEQRLLIRPRTKIHSRPLRIIAYGLHLPIVRIFSVLVNIVKAARPAAARSGAPWGIA